MYQALVRLLASKMLQMLLANLSITNLPNDNGSLLKPSMSTTDIVSIINSLNQEQKYNLLKCHFVPSDIFIPQET